MEQRSVSGILTCQSDAEATVQALKDAGFSISDVSVLIGPRSDGDTPGPSDPTMVGESTAAGLIAGGTLGGILGLLAGMGSLAVPGLGTLIAAGPIMGTLTGLGAGGAVGGLAGSLIGLGIPEDQSEEYEGRIRKGDILLSVRVCDVAEEQKVRSILEDNSAEEISSQDEWDERGAVVDGATSYRSRV